MSYVYGKWSDLVRFGPIVVAPRRMTSRGVAWRGPIVVRLWSDLVRSWSDSAHEKTPAGPLGRRGRQPVATR